MTETTRLNREDFIERRLRCLFCKLFTCRQIHKCHRLKHLRLSLLLIHNLFSLMLIQGHNFPVLSEQGGIYSKLLVASLLQTIYLPVAQPITTCHANIARLPKQQLFTISHSISKHEKIRIRQILDNTKGPTRQLPGNKNWQEKSVLQRMTTDILTV